MFSLAGCVGFVIVISQDVFNYFYQRIRAECLCCILLCCCSQPFEELKAQLASVHTIIAAPALASSELIKELQLLYSVVIVHVGLYPCACVCSVFTLLLMPIAFPVPDLRFQFLPPPPSRLS